MSAPPTIGVFDSGFGGLTVLRALRASLPGARYVYLGDTARLPYGSKSQATVARYAVESGRFLVGRGADLLVVACNTASALALDQLRASLPIPILGVIEPGTRAAAAANKGPVLVLATAATVQSGAYTRELHALGRTAYEKACPLLVPLVEEGWTSHHVTAEVLRIYLAEALVAAPTTNTLVLGCTHYPLLKPLIERTLAELGQPLLIVDAAEATANAATLLVTSAGDATPKTPTFYATDSVDKFKHLGTRFLGEPLQHVHLLDLGG